MNRRLTHSRRWFTRSLAPLITAALALTSSGCVGGGCNGSQPIPETDTCDTPLPGGGFTALEIGLSGGEDFAPLADGEVIQPISGGQGSDMILAFLKVSGVDVPACLPQSTSVLVDDSVIANVNLPLSTTALAGGGRVSGEMWLVLDYAPWGSRATIRAQAGELTTEVDVYLWEMLSSYPDAAVDAAWADAAWADAAPDAPAPPADAAPDAAPDASGDASIDAPQ